MILPPTFSVAEVTDSKKLSAKKRVRLYQEIYSRAISVGIGIVDPLEMVDETLSEVEEKVLREVAMAAGARDVKIWLGEVLTDRELLNV